MGEILSDGPIIAALDVEMQIQGHVHQRHWSRPFGSALLLLQTCCTALPVCYVTRNVMGMNYRQQQHGQHRKVRQVARHMANAGATQQCT